MTPTPSAREIAAVWRARRKFKTGDRVAYDARGWTGTVTGEPSDTGVVWCRFDQVGQYGADPRGLRKLRRLLTEETNA